jgi:hypothetical protein
MMTMTKASRNHSLLSRTTTLLHLLRHAYLLHHGIETLLTPELTRPNHIQMHPASITNQHSTLSDARLIQNTPLNLVAC